ncbi:response regulator [Bacillus sp. S/N-304-OC-R1]|uniref:response regulator transcription factor n=1 Tax=Bacillus sp. S/N-304-OC-R1 TaxID=2758034 RepID=UPI001C8D91E3|nr:response regulator [Bacillus sp. S/N-304-OC-R1]MBY0121133.1 response regulator [Bacillus sp. S/N-304-OC-R1]
MKILLVDDEPLELLNLKKILNDFGERDVILVENGLDAIDTLKNEQIDMIFLDIKMPGLSGLETLEIIRKDWPDKVVAIVSAYSDFQYAQKAIELGASSYLLKPFRKQDFIETFMKLRTLWDEKRSRNMLFKQSLLENLIYGEGHLPNSEVLRYFTFIPKVVVTIKCELANWKENFVNYFSQIEGYLTPEPIGDVFLYITSKQNLEITMEKILQLEIELGDSFVYGYGVSNQLKNSYQDALKYMDTKDESIVNRSMQFIQTNYYKALTLTDVAQAVHVSVSHLNRLLKKEKGKTFTEILLNVRINKAKELLKQNYNVEVVSDMVGFNSPAYFAVSFKKFTGISPSQYKRGIG